MLAEADHNTLADDVRIDRAPSGDGFRLTTSLWLPRSREQIFQFFGDAFQLETLTPPWLHFSVLTPAPIRIEPGTLIDYQLRLHGVPLRWQSRISVWEPSSRFVDEQVRGPYRRWHHEHTFESLNGGTLCRDTVDYATPGGWLANTLFVRRNLLSIFRFRQQKMRQLFPASHLEPSS